MRKPVFWIVIVFTAGALAFAAGTVPEEIQQPGTQPGDLTNFSYNTGCGCHGGYNDEGAEPEYGWAGSMMAHAARDPIFWATVAIAEQDFLPGSDPDARGGAGDLCLRCHAPNAWLGGRSVPTDGSALTGADERGVECEHCHLMVNPDQPTNIPGTVEEQHAPFEAFDPVTGEPYFGSGQYVINTDAANHRLGPYDDAEARHDWAASSFHRSGEFCGTCHDVSNPAVGDLAHNFGAQHDLDPGTYSGTLGSPVDDKAAFNNPPYRYGVVERTFSEWKASAWDTYRVNDYPSLPADLQEPNGILDFAYHQAFDARSNADFVDGAPRYYTCQTCHMSVSSGSKGCKQGALRDDLARHDLTGAGYWMPDVINYQDNKGTLRFGGGMTATEVDMMMAGKIRSTERIQAAATLAASQPVNDLVVRVTNLTGHKLISGYPEGRRMWLNVIWRNDVGTVIHEDGGYGEIGRTVTDLDGTAHQVRSILDLDDTVIFEAEMGLDQGWASQLLGLGYDPGLALSYDRLTDAPEHTLGELGGASPGTKYHSFHFVLNNTMLHDGRIPPYGFSYDEAQFRNALPVPADQFGNPGPGGTYDYWVDIPFTVPSGAATAEVNLYYQQTSWEYIQFLWLGNDGQNAFLGNEGVNMLDAWLNTGQNEPLLMETTTVSVTSSAAVPGETSHHDIPAELMLVTSYDEGTGNITISYTPACDAGNHTIYFGDLANVSFYGYSGADCNVGTGGSATFNPGVGAAFFLISANNGVSEGSYGEDSSNLERPEDTGTPGCDYPQDLGGVVCE